MKLRTIAGTTLCLMLYAHAAIADAPLKSKLGLDAEQAKVVAEIQAKHRNLMRGERQELNREARVLRRANSANDSELIASQEKVVRALELAVRERTLAEDAETRKVLNAEQLKKFEAYLKQRNEMVGSSRDARALKAK